FHKDVVECPASPVHPAVYPHGCQPSGAVETGARCPLSTREDVRSRHRQGVGERCQTNAHVHGARPRPRPHRPTAPIHHRHEVHTPTMEPHSRDVRTPALLPPCARHLPPHRRLHPMGRRRRAHPGLGSEPLHPPGTPPPRPALLLPRVPVTPPPGGHPTHTLVRRVGGWLRPPRPQRERL